MTSPLDEDVTKLIPEHHVQAEFCFTRPPYRDPNQPKAVKVYTVSQESCFLMIQNVPTLGVGKQLAILLHNSSTLIRFEKLTDFPCESFTESYLVKYTTLSAARYIKRKYDNHVFYAAKLHISYAPEYETSAETLQKLVAFRAAYNRNLCSINTTQSVDVRKNKRRKPISSSHISNLYPISAKQSMSELGNFQLQKVMKSSESCKVTALSNITQPHETATKRLIGPTLPKNLKPQISPVDQTQNKINKMFSNSSYPAPHGSNFNTVSTFRPLPRQVQLKQKQKPCNYLVNEEILNKPLNSQTFLNETTNLQCSDKTYVNSESGSQSNDQSSCVRNSGREFDQAHILSSSVQNEKNKPSSSSDKRVIKKRRRI